MIFIVVTYYTQKVFDIPFGYKPGEHFEFFDFEEAVQYSDQKLATGAFAEIWMYGAEQGWYRILFAQNYKHWTSQVQIG